MPRKSTRGRGRNYTSSPTVSVTSTTNGSSRRATSSVAGTNGKGAPLAPKQSGRRTKNSNGNRGRKLQSSRRTPVPKANGKGGRRKRDIQDPASYKSEDGVVYSPGDYAYVDSQQPELPYHICIIKDFKLVRNSVIAEVKWFYRVTELPEAVYLLLMEDRKNGVNSSTFTHPKVKDRELFMAFNKDTHPASLFRGKCYIKKLDELCDKMTDFLDKEDSFFYAYGYKPESRRLTLENEESFVPGSQQAVLPDCICPDPKEVSPDSSTTITESELRNEASFPAREEKVWDPQLSDDDLLMYLRAARSIALHAGVCMTGMLADGYLAASSDETTQHAFDVLYRNRNNTENALQELVKQPIVSRLVGKKNWSKEDSLLFSKGMRQFGKNFFKIRTELLPGKQITELVEYYYYWKKTEPGLNSRSTRRQRKAAHIRLSRTLQKSREVTPDKELVDWSSCDEDEGESGEDGEKGKAKSYYACHHCYTMTGVSWHHAGPDRAILCDNCRIHFKNYGLMRPLTIKREPPEFMFKDYHEGVTQREESSTPPASGSLQSTPPKKRKTRNSNGTRGAARPGLRSAKTYTEKNDSDEDEEAEASESSESSEYETPMPVSKPKPLQARRSILDNLDESHKDDIDMPPPPKRQKREQLAEGSMSEEEGSLGSSNGESTQKSPNRDHSPEESVSSVNDEEGDSPCNSSQASPDHVPLPQQFSRVAKDRESSCARTDLVYLYEKKAANTAKVSAFSVPGTSAHGGHSSELPTPTANVKVPIITPHAPQLPMGPPAFVGFPQAPFQPGAAPQGGEAPEVKRSNSIESSSNREREHQQQQQLLQQQQQQQQWLALMQQQQSQGASAHLHPSHPHFTPVTVGYPGGTLPTQVHHHEQAQQGPVQPMVFTFPPQEDVSMRRLASQIPGTPDQHHLAAMLQQGVYPTAALFASQMEPSRLHEEQQQQQHGLATPQPQLVVPGMNISMDQYILLQQQQQQQAAAMAAGLSPVDNQPFLEFQRYFDGVMQQVQKEPNLMQHPQVQHLISQRNLLVQQAQSLQMAGQDQHQINLFLQQNLARIQQEQVMIQQAHAHQEAAAQKQKFVLGRPPAVSDNAPSRSRPGVIVGSK